MITDDIIISAIHTAAKENGGIISISDVYDTLGFRRKSRREWVRKKINCTPQRITQLVKNSGYIRISKAHYAAVTITTE